MADTAQVIYEYTAGNTLSFFTNNLKIIAKRPGLSIDCTVDGTLVVTDTSASQLIFTCDAELSGADWNTLLGVQRAAIDYTGAYPRLTTVYLASATTLTNVEVALWECTGTDLGDGRWSVHLEFREKDK